MLPKERVDRAKKEANEEIFKIQLSQLRKKFGITQENIKVFSQSGISKIENRKDMKLSTLIQYLDSIGLGMEIKVYSKHSRKNKEEILLQTNLP
jgi:glycosylphosphatidylinositol transamidase (GPIT) subunit GPI8